MRSIRSRVAMAVGALVVSMLAACSGIPTSGSVTVGATLDEPGESEFEVLPLGPAPDATQEEVLRGFIAALAGSRNDYEVARQFLSPGFADEWDPRSSVVVRSAGTADPVRIVDEDSMEYSIDSAGTVDLTGSFVQNDDAVPLTRQFDFVEVGGQWRIDQTDDGIVVSDAQFHSLFRQHSLYFLDASGTRLVPDVRWFLGGTAALRIITALLEGPPEWLRGAVSTTFPDGTSLVDPDLAVQSGVALVDLSEEVLAADTRERQLMQVQLTASLSNVANIRGVRLAVQGTPLDIEELGSAGPQPDPAVDGRALVMRDGEFGYLSGASVDTIQPLSGKVAALEATAATLAADGETVAVLGSAGVSVARTDADQSITLDARADLTPPSLDNDGFIWVSSRSEPGAVRVYTGAGAVTPLATGLPPTAQIVSLDVSRDGSRVAILATTPSGQRLVVKAIARDASQDQLPVALGVPVLDTVVAGSTAIDATWTDDISIATIAEESGETVGREFVVGGERTALGTIISGATAIIGGNGERGVRALSTAGTIVIRSGSSWSDSGVAVTFIATQR